MSRTCITDADIFAREVLESDLPVVAEFASDWVGASAEWKSMMGEMAREYAGRIKFVIVDMARYCPEFVAKQWADRKSQLIAFRDGERAGRLSAPAPQPEIWRWIYGALDVPPACGVVMAVQPRYAEAIASGTKRVEFRQVRMREAASHAVFYATAPQKRLVCVCEVFWVDWADLDALWARWGDKGGIGRDEFDAYFAECENGFAISLDKPRAIKQDVALRDLGIDMPPRTYRYIDRMELSWLLDKGTQERSEINGR